MLIVVQSQHWLGWKRAVSCYKNLHDWRLWQLCSLNLSWECSKVSENKKMGIIKNTRLFKKWMHFGLYYHHQNKNNHNCTDWSEVNYLQLILGTICVLTNSPGPRKWTVGAFFIMIGKCKILINTKNEHIYIYI